MELRTKKLIYSWATYLAVCLFLTFINYVNYPQYFWVLWGWAGWGLGVILNTVKYFVFCSGVDKV